MKFCSLANRNFKEIYRDPVSVLLGLFMPVALLFLFASMQKNIQLDVFKPQYLAPGIIVFGFAFLSMFSAVLLAKDKESAFLIRLFSTPLQTSDYILSYVLPFLPLALSQVAICLIVGTVLGATFSQLVLALLVFMLMAITCISIGVLLGALLSVNQVSGVGSFLITVIALFSGAWMDLKAIGGVFESIGYALPFAHAVDASKALLSGSSFDAVSHHIYVIFSFALSFSY